MKIYLLDRKLGTGEGTGWERYSYLLSKGLTGKGIEVFSSSQDLKPIKLKSFNSLYGPLFYDILIVPALLAKNCNNYMDIYHATLPQQAIFFPLLPKNRTIVTFHDLAYTDFKPSSLESFSWKLYAKKTDMIAVRSCGHIISVSSQTKEDLVEKLGVPESKISVVPLCIDKHFKPMKSQQRDFFVIGYLGALVGRKKIDYLIESIRILKEKHPQIECRLVICGIGPEYENLIRLAHYLKLKDVAFTGFIPEDLIVKAYNTFDVFVFPSKHEGFGLPILEAQSCGVPVIVRKEARIPTEVKRCTIQCNDKVDLANKIFNLLTNDDLYQKISQKGLVYARQFSLEKFIEKTMEVYEKCFQ
jgi:glycosyltransferase involved in cell wall biosynthesis